MNIDRWQENSKVLALEKGTIFKKAPVRVALIFPNSYAVGMSSLGFQVIYALFNQDEHTACERFFFPANYAYLKAASQPIRSIETMTPLTHFEVIAISITAELDLLNIFKIFDLCHLPILKKERDNSHPVVIFGGPMTYSNYLPLTPFADLIVIGEGESPCQFMLNHLLPARDKTEFIKAASRHPGIYSNFNATPAFQIEPQTRLPVQSLITTPLSHFSNMHLMEITRGCPGQCRFCIINASNGSFRWAEKNKVLQALPLSPQKIGFIGGGLSFHPDLAEILSATVLKGHTISLSSLRADMLDTDLLEILRRGDFMGLTVSIDALSQRLRDQIGKKITAEKILRLAEKARHIGGFKLKLYVMIGLPEETEADTEEFLGLIQTLKEIMPLAIKISLFIPKKFAAMAAEPFCPIPILEARILKLKKGLPQGVKTDFESPKWAFISYLFSQGDDRLGQLAYQVYQKGWGYKAFIKALKEAGEDI